MGPRTPVPGHHSPPSYRSILVRGYRFRQLPPCPSPWRRTGYYFCAILGVLWFAVAVVPFMPFMDFMHGLMRAEAPWGYGDECHEEGNCHDGSISITTTTTVYLHPHRAGAVQTNIRSSEPSASFARSPAPLVAASRPALFHCADRPSQPINQITRLTVPGNRRPHTTTQHHRTLPCTTTNSLLLEHAGKLESR